MIQYCIDVFIRTENKEWKLWYTQSFKTKKLAKVWEIGFKNGLSPTHMIFKYGRWIPQIGPDKKLSDIYKRKRDYEPNVK